MRNNPYHCLKIAHHRRVISALVVNSLLLVVTGCDSSSKETKPTVTINNTAANLDKPSLLDKNNSDYQAVSKDGFIAADDSASTPEGVKKVVDANNQFAIDMYQQINGQPEQADKNVFFSPYSLSTAMAMLYAAAEGETKQQIQKTSHYPTMPILNPNSAALYNQFNRPNPDYKLATVNDLWMEKQLTPTKAYVDTVQRYYGGQVTNLDFENSPDPSRLIINKKIAQHTNQLIPELLPENSIQSDVVAVLTNAVYFKGDWKMPFEANSTTEQPFYSLMSKVSDVKMMNMQADFGYHEDKQVQVVQLPYKGDDLSMLVILPKSKGKARMQDLSADKIKEWNKDLVTQEVNLYLPKFKLAERYDMKALLSAMGMPSAFQNKARFKLFDEPLQVKIDDVYHQAVVIVDEKGTEAAAATAIVAVNASAPINQPVEFKADHPFIFLIKNNKTDAILFLGQVNKL